MNNLMKNGKLWRNLALVLVAGCVVFGVSWRLANPPPGPINTPEDLLQRLQEKGLDCEGKKVAERFGVYPALNPGFYLKRSTNTKTWEELAAEIYRRPEVMKDYVTIAPEVPGTDVITYSGPGRAVIEKLVIVGDPTLVEEIKTHLLK